MIKQLQDNLIRDLCSVEFRAKSKTRRLIEEYTNQLLKITDTLSRII